MVHETASEIPNSDEHVSDERDSDERDSDEHDIDEEASRHALDALVDRVRREGAGTRLPTLVPGPHGLLILAAAVLVGFLGWWFLARPAPLEDRMPSAAEVGSEESGNGDGASSGGPGSAGAGSGGASSDSASSDSASSDSASSGGEGAAAGSGSEGGSVTVHIAGAVFEPGLVTLGEGARVADAVTAASGLTAVADLDRTNLAAPVADGARVFIPVRGQPVPGEIVPTGGSGGGSGGGEPGPLDLNSADSTQLESLPGIGPATAEAIISHRDENGPFESVDALIDVRGIGEAKLEALRDLVNVP